MNKNKLAAAVIIIAMVGSFSALPAPTYADSNTQQTTPANLGSINKEVKFLGESTVILKNVYLIPTDNGQIFYTTLEVNNKSNSELDFYPYWMQMQTVTGVKFPVSTTSVGNQKVLPGAKRTFSYYSAVPGHIQISDLALNLVKWDFTLPSYKRHIYSFTLPDQAVFPQVGKDGSHIADIQGLPVSMSVENVRVSSAQNSKTVKMNIAYLNQGMRPVKVPTYVFTLRGKDGYVYPVTISETKEINALPRIKQSVALTVQIPADADLSNYSLVVSEPLQGSADGGTGSPVSFAVPIAGFELSEGGSPSSNTGYSKLGEKLNVSLGGYDFEMEVDNIQMNPSFQSFETNISYEVSLKNTSDKSVPYPKLKSRIDVPLKGVYAGNSNPETQDMILPGQEVKLYLSASIPDNISFQRFIIHLESIEEASSTDIASFQMYKRNIKKSEVDLSKAYHFSDLGVKSTVKLYSVNSYDVSGAELIATSFLVENKDLRPIKIPEYKGYFQTKDGAVFPAEFKNKNQSISPKSSAVITYWSEMPVGYDLTDLNFVLGQPVDKDSDAFKESVSYMVIGSSRTPATVPVHSQTTFTHTLVPLMFSISGLEASEVENTIEFYFKKSIMPNFVGDDSGRTITMEVVDVEGNILSTPFEINSSVSSGMKYISYTESPSMYGESEYVILYESLDNGKREIAKFFLN